MALKGKGWLVAAMMVVSMGGGCTASRYRVMPGQVGLQVEAPQMRCGEGDRRDIPVKVHVRNDGRGILRVWIDDASGPPYRLSWPSYEVLDDAGNVEGRHGPSGLAVPRSQLTLTMASGDRTEVTAMLHDIGEADYVRSFRIRIQDDEKHAWTTDAFRPCVQSG